MECSAKVSLRALDFSRIWLALELVAEEVKTAAARGRVTRDFNHLN